MDGRGAVGGVSVSGCWWYLGLATGEEVAIVASELKVKKRG